MPALIFSHSNLTHHLILCYVILYFVRSAFTPNQKLQYLDELHMMLLQKLVARDFGAPAAKHSVTDVAALLAKDNTLALMQ